MRMADLSLLVPDRHHGPPDQKFPFPASPGLVQGLAWPHLCHLRWAAMPHQHRRGLWAPQRVTPKTGARGVLAAGPVPQRALANAPGCWRASADCAAACDAVSFWGWACSCWAPAMSWSMLYFFFFLMGLGFLFVFLRQKRRHVQLWCSCLSVTSTPSSDFWSLIEGTRLKEIYIFARSMKASERSCSHTSRGRRVRSPGLPHALPPPTHPAALTL